MKQLNDRAHEGYDEECLSLLRSASVVQRPSKENHSNAPFHFPKYLENDWPAPISIEKAISQPRISYLIPSPLVSLNSKYTIAREHIMNDNRTTCMIKNIPNRITSEQLIEFINESHFGTFDFIYLRIDFRNKCNVGYAFINFVDRISVLRLYDRIHGKGWNHGSSAKVAELTYASIQGIDSLRIKFQNSALMRVDRAYRPKMFFVSGPHRGREKEEFR